MSKHLLLWTVLIGFLFLGACSKDKNDGNTNLSDTPLAKAEYNSSNYGIYKGVFIGSSGTVMVNVKNDNTLAATIKVDGSTLNFTSNSVVVANQQSSIGFTDGTNSFTFTVSANGQNPLVTNLIINGHPSSKIDLVKETSTFLVKCYEGSFSGDDRGTINAIMWDNNLRAVIKSSSSNGFDQAFSVVSNGKVNAGTVTTGATFTGTIVGIQISGQWQNTQYNQSGSWSVMRTY